LNLSFAGATAEVVMATMKRRGRLVGVGLHDRSS